jgi:phosphoglycolate phosphatase
MIMPVLPHAVIFDLDGTLVHSSPDIAHHLNAALGEVFGSDSTLPLDDVENMIGRGMLDLIDNGIDALGITPTAEEADNVLKCYREGYLAEPVVKSSLYDGVIAALDDLQSNNVSLGICTNKPEATACGVLDYFGLTDRFGAFVGGDTVSTRKPDAAPLLEACRRLDVSAGNAIMVGDSEADFGAARNAGVKIAMVDWGYSSVDITTLGGDLVISGYDGFGEKLKVLFA